MCPEDDKWLFEGDLFIPFKIWEGDLLTQISDGYIFKIDTSELLNFFSPDQITCYLLVVLFWPRGRSY